MRLSVVIPFHRNLEQLARCLDALTHRPAGSEVIVVADAAVDDCRPLVRARGGRVVSLADNRGPAVARNRGAAVAAGDVLVFIDTDVVISPGVLDRVVSTLADRPDICAVYGAYDEHPAAPNFASQYKNLAHSYIHQSSRPVSQTFWAGFGAIRRSAFVEVGGFDERFGRPCIEDIDLGYRLTAAGHAILLAPQLDVCHLKRWTVWGIIRSDIVDRGIPWTQLILRYGRVHDDLNLRSPYRASVVLTYLVTGLALGALALPGVALGIPPGLAALVLLNRGILGFFLERRGWWFTLRAVPLHYLYHQYNGLSFLVGTSLYWTRRLTGLRLPGSLPVDAWMRRLPVPLAGSSATTGRHLQPTAAETQQPARKQVRS